MDKITRTRAREICTTRWFYNPDGTVTLSFHNHLTDVCVYKPYKTVAAAKTAETKFHKRVSRIYDQKYAL